MTDSPLKVKLDAFEGPLDLLLHLIRENKVDIFDIPIAVITDQYLEHLRVMKELDLNISGEFLVMAATLVYIKSKMLLPAEPNDDEADDGIDPRDELVAKLLEYQSFKEAAKELGLLAKERSRVYTRQIAECCNQFTAVDFADTDFSANLYDLIQAFSRVLQEQNRDDFHEVYEEVVAIDEMVTVITRLLDDNERVSFKTLCQTDKSRNMLIATFFAILELCKQKVLRIEQTDVFGDIILHKV